MKTSGGMVLVALVCVGAASCGGSSDPSVDGGATTDGAVTTDAAATVDATATVDAAGIGSATWTLVPNPVCTSNPAVSTVCIDMGAQGGFQLAASAACPLNNGRTLLVAGGGPPPAGTYNVKPVNTYADALNLTAGQIVPRAIFHPNGTTQEEWWGQSGTITVTNVGGKVTYMGTNLVVKKFAMATTTTLSLTASCP